MASTAESWSTIRIRLKLGRLKLKVPSVLGGDVVTGWATPCAPYGGAADQGFLFIPDVGAGVWTEFEEGDLEFPIWAGTFWSQPNSESELPKPNKGSDGIRGEQRSRPADVEDRQDGQRAHAAVRRRRRLRDDPASGGQPGALPDHGPERNHGHGCQCEYHPVYIGRNQGSGYEQQHRLR